MQHLPALPEGYSYSLSEPNNLLLALHRTESTLYLDEESMTWRVLDRHVSQVHHAPVSSTC